MVPLEKVASRAGDNLVSVVVRVTPTRLGNQVVDIQLAPNANIGASIEVAIDASHLVSKVDFPVGPFCSCHDFVRQTERLGRSAAVSEASRPLHRLVGQLWSHEVQGMIHGFPLPHNIGSPDIRGLGVEHMHLAAKAVLNRGDPLPIHL